VTDHDRRRGLIKAYELLGQIITDWDATDGRLEAWAHGVRSSTGDRGPKGAYSNPTAAQALMRDHFGRDYRDLHRKADQVVRHVFDLEHLRVTTMQDVIPAEPQNRGLSQCANAHGWCQEWATKAGRCPSCYEYLRRTGRDRTEPRD
jgi:hypothetical protein